MTDKERAMLEQHLEWLLTDVIPGFKRSQQPPSWKAKSIRMAEMQVANIRWRLDTGRDAPECGWKGVYADHPLDCPYCTGTRKTNNPYGKRGKPKIATTTTDDTQEG